MCIIHSLFINPALLCDYCWCEFSQTSLWELNIQNFSPRFLFLSRAKTSGINSDNWCPPLLASFAYQVTQTSKFWLFSFICGAEFSTLQSTRRNDGDKHLLTDATHLEAPQQQKPPLPLKMFSIHGKKGYSREISYTVAAF